MNAHIELPFEKPIFTTYHNYAASGFALAKHPEGKHAFINHCTDLRCDRSFLRGYTTPNIDCPGASLHNINYFFRRIVCNIYAEHFLREIIYQMLNEGMYVYFGGVDDYYIPGKSWYGIRHMMHDGIIIGYDDNEKTYTIAAYNINWIFSPFKIPQESFAQAVKSGVESKANFCSIVGLELKNERIHLETNATPERLKQYIRTDLKEYPPEKTGKVTGIAVHDYIAMYMEMLHNGKIPYERMDWRVMRLIWEFRVCMQERLTAIEKQLKLGNTSSEQYKEILGRTNHLRMLYAIYSKKEKNSLPLLIRDELLVLKNAEKEILTQFIRIKEEKVPV